MTSNIKENTYSILQRRVWRWHFYAGLMVIPFAILLAATGSLYLFKPQYENFIEQRINAKSPATVNQNALPVDTLLETVSRQYPDSRLQKIILPKNNDRSIEFEIKTANGLYVLWVDTSTGIILHEAAHSKRLMHIVKKLHSELLAGDRGSLVVELMASWMIVLIITGVVLWWPRPFNYKVHRMFLPVFKGLTGRQLWRKIHGLTGIWCAGLILVLLISGLPWTQVWGEGFKRLQDMMGWDNPGQEWFVTLQSGHPKQPGTNKNINDGLDLWERGSRDGNTVTLKSQLPTNNMTPLPIQAIVDIVAPQQLPPPVEIHSPKGDNGVWTIRSMIQNRPKRVTVHYDRWTGAEIMRIGFNDYHPVKQITSIGVALHEGALFGWPNQILGLITALGVITLSISGVIIWWQRRPTGRLGVPPIPGNKSLRHSATISIVLLMLFLPMFMLSLITVIIIDTVGRRVLKSF